MRVWMIDRGWRLEERTKFEDEKHGVLIEFYGHLGSLGLGIDSQHLNIRVGIMTDGKASMLRMATAFMTHDIQHTTLAQKKAFTKLKRHFLVVMILMR